MTTRPNKIMERDRLITLVWIDLWSDDWKGKRWQQQQKNWTRGWVRNRGWDGTRPMVNIINHIINIVPLNDAQYLIRSILCLCLPLFVSSFYALYACVCCASNYPIQWIWSHPVIEYINYRLATLAIEWPSGFTAMHFDQFSFGEKKRLPVLW